MKSISLLLLLLGPLYLIAQSPQRPKGKGKPKASIVGTIKGTLYDNQSQNPIEFATISLKKSGEENIINGSITEPDGTFKITEVPVGTYDLIINFLGYQEKTITSIELTLRNPDYDLDKISLEPDNVILNEVEVVGQRAIVENHIDKLVYNAENDPSTRGGDASDVLRKVPLLNVDMQGNVSLRGSQNVRILMNGKPSGMFSGSVADALKMVPADQIVKVEVITTPSAKYDAEGSAGIINIITKKKSIDGFAGNVSTTIGTRINRGNLGLNYAKGRFGLNASGGGFYRIPNDADNYSINRNYTNGELLSSRESRGQTESSAFGYRGQIGAFYDINAFNSINSNINLRGFQLKNEGTLNTLSTRDIMQEYLQSTYTKNLRSGFDWSTDYTRKFDTEGHELVFAVQLDKQINNSDNDILWSGDINRDQINDNESDNDEWTLQLDYTKPISDKLKIETGAKGILRKIDSDYLQEELNANGVYEVISAQTNNFTYNQDVYAGYLSTNYTFDDNWAILAGLRYENTSIDFDNPGPNETGELNREYDNFIPSVILSRKINMSTIKASYNQRLQRPSLRFINPYRNYVDDDVYSVGNPDLDPELSHQYELSFSTFIKGTVINFATYYRHTDDVIASYLTTDDAGANVTTFDNLGTSNDLGFNLFTSTTINNNLTLRFSADIANTKLEGGEQVFGEALENDVWTYRLFGNGSWNLSGGWKIDLFGFLNSPRYTLQGKQPSFSILSMGVNKDIFGERGSIGLSIIEPFNENKEFETELESADVYSYSNREVPFRSIGLNFSYRFGKLDFNERKSKRSSKIKNSDQKGGNDGGQGNF